jgi:hypothetical protein
MQNSYLPGKKKRILDLKPRHWFWLVGWLILAGSLIPFYSLLAGDASQQREAPETDRIISAQSNLPFQALFPAYLPEGFNRSRMQVITNRPGPAGEAMIQLVYSTWWGDTLTVREWLSAGQGKAGQASALPSSMAGGVECTCICRSRTECSMVEAAKVIDGVRVVVSISKPDLITRSQYLLILDAMEPAASRRIYTSQEEIPSTFSLPLAEEVPINSAGIQEVTLVVSANGYSPLHFAVKKGVPVRLIF